MKKKLILIMVVMLVILSVLPIIGCIEDEIEVPKDEIEIPKDEIEVPKSDYITLSANGKAFQIILYDNPTVKALKKMLPLKIEMLDMPHEKYCYLDKNLPTDAYSPKVIKAGDVMLFGGNCLVVFYESFTTSYSYTPIGRIEDLSDLAKCLGDGKVLVSFYL